MLHKRVTRAVVLGVFTGLTAVGSFVYVSEHGIGAKEARAQDIDPPKVKKWLTTTCYPCDSGGGTCDC